MNRSIAAVAAITLALHVSSASAQLRPPLPTCPNLSAERTTSTPPTAQSQARMASDALVAEGLATTRVLSSETVRKGIATFERAVRTDPTNAEAHIALARAHTQSQRYLSVRKNDAQARARKRLTTGRQLSPNNVDGLHLLADVLVASTHDYACTKQILESALLLDPRNARSHHYYSQLLSGMGQFDLAFQHADRALAYADAATRTFVSRNLGRPRYMAGQYEWVLTQYMAAEQDAPLAHFYRSLAHGALGHASEALQEAQASLAGDPARDAGGLGMVALAYANAGQPEAARALLRELLERDARGEHVVEYRIAAVYEVLGEHDEAFRWLDKQIADADGLGSWLLWLNHDPVWSELRKDRRWNGIHKRAGW